MSDNLLHVVVNNTAILEFDRGKPVPGHQRQYIDGMDARMDKGIQFDGQTIEDPNPMQRAQFVANSLINSLYKEDYGLATAMCTYLAKRIPDLKQIKAIGDIDKELSIELVFDRDFEKAQQEQPIEFMNFSQDKPIKLN